jgi:DNA repair exonuclease SbcCD ATPase subunit
MTAERTEKTLSELRDSLQSSLVEDAHQQEAKLAIAKLETQLQGKAPANLDVLEDVLRQWEADVEVNHPMLASIVSETLRRLAAMGI